MVCIEGLTTEERNKSTEYIDRLSIYECLDLMSEEDKKVPVAVEEKLHEIEGVINQVVKTFKNGGRLIYIGSGTSGRLGILDAVECVPTFGTEPELVQGIIAGGNKALWKAVEGAEDDIDLARQELGNIHLNDKDMVIGVAASGRTPYVVGGLKFAKQVGAVTGCVCCNTNTDIGKIAEYPIEISVGPEFLTGSTRLKAGTAQKLVLNMISTISMIQIGKVYKNLMVDVQPTNEKLVERAKRIIVDATGATYETAEKMFIDSDMNVKIAIVRILTGTSFSKAKVLLEEKNGFIRNICD